MEYEHHFSQYYGHAESSGRGPGADTLPGDGSLNFREGYAQIENLRFREDDALVPPFGTAEMEGTVTRIVRLLKGNDGLYGIGENGRLYFTEGIGSAWVRVNWAFWDEPPLLPDTDYSSAILSDGRMVFKPVGNYPAFITEPAGLET